MTWTRLEYVNNNLVMERSRTRADSRKRRGEYRDIENVNQKCPNQSQPDVLVCALNRYSGQGTIYTLAEVDEHHVNVTSSLRLFSLNDLSMKFHILI